MNTQASRHDAIRAHLPHGAVIARAGLPTRYRIAEMWDDRRADGIATIRLHCARLDSHDANALFDVWLDDAGRLVTSVFRIGGWHVVPVLVERPAVQQLDMFTMTGATA